MYTTDEMYQMTLARWLEASAQIAELKRERDEMQAEYEALYDALREEISQWREAMRQIEQTANSALALTHNDYIGFIAWKARDIQDCYPIQLTGDDDSESPQAKPGTGTGLGTHG